MALYSSADSLRVLDKDGIVGSYTFWISSTSVILVTSKLHPLSNVFLCYFDAYNAERATRGNNL